MKKNTFNPFFIQAYGGASCFCDREKETDSLLENIRNGRNTTLVSPRKYGKTGLIQHAFETIKCQKEPLECLYTDVFATSTLDDFVKALSGAIMSHFPEKNSAGKMFRKILYGLRPVLYFDSLTGNPQLQFNFQNESEKIKTLENLLQFLEGMNKDVVVAIDEFQQIATYEDVNMEALLRGYIQQMRNVHFIFSGSKQTLMSEMFMSPKRPFFSSTSMLSLDRIPEESYGPFIERLFAEGNMTVREDALDMILRWTRRHTFYTQYLCNALYAKRPKEVTLPIVLETCDQILGQYSPTYIQYRELLTQVQWKMLVALAKEGVVSQPSNTAFMKKYGINGATSARRTLQALVDKELVLPIADKEHVVYQVYDVFFSHWLSREF